MTDPVPSANEPVPTALEGAAAVPLTVAPTVWSPLKKLVVSAMIIFHLLGVFVCPASLGGPLGGSPFLNRLYDRVFHWHLEPLHLMHGYQFFAPQPSAAKVIQYTLTFPEGMTDPDGTPDKGWQFPDRNEIRPRLMYHRYFMLAERLPLGDEAAMQVILMSYARHLVQKHGAIAISIHVVEHDLIYPQEVIDGMDPDSPELYTELAFKSWTREELGVD